MHASPGIQVEVSAAVFSNYPNCRDSVGQDWLDWVQKGYVDFIAPMDYTDSHYYFALIVAQQLDQVKGLVPVYPGIGVSSSSGRLGVDGVIVQILETRNQHTGGFVLFSYNSLIRTVV